MLALFDGDDLRSLSVWPNAQALYFEATPEGLLDSAIEASADSLAFVFVDGEVRGIDGDRGIQGTIYGAEIVPEGRRLPGFAFQTSGAPTREALLGDGWEVAWLEANGPPAAWLLPPGGARPEADPPPDEPSPEADTADADRSRR